ncbi:MAG: DUF268 domain-containing protein [Rhodospirillum sp.]|nr:DUF268 domain-containing protein [Rhodospirillum sp.]
MDEEIFKKNYSALLAGHRKNPRFILSPNEIYPCLEDDQSQTDFDAHYVYHTAWAARVVRDRAPVEHVDISSYLYFATLLSAFVPIRFVDIRPAPIVLDNLVSERADVTALPFADASLPSLSCMHVVEHVGLGRYGDPVNYEGDLDAVAELKRVLAPGGDLLFVVPVGTPRLVYNAHRIYAATEVVRMFADDCDLTEFALIPDDPRGGLERHSDPARGDAQVYGCGCFHFTRREASVEPDGKPVAARLTASLT